MSESEKTTAEEAIELGEGVAESEIEVPDTDTSDEDDVFSGVVGHDGAKAFVSAALRKGDAHILLHGPPGSGKSVMMLAIEDNLPPGTVVYKDSKQITPSRLRETLKDDPPILILDEIDALDNKAYDVLSIPMEHGRLVRDSAQEQYDVEVGTQIIAACNYPDELPDHIESRFRNIEFEEYSHDEYLDVCAVMLTTSDVDYIETEKEAREFAQAVAESLGEDDVRAVRDIGKLATSLEEAKQLAAVRHDPDAKVDVAPLKASEVARAKGVYEKDRLTQELVRELLEASQREPGSESEIREEDAGDGVEDDADSVDEDEEARVGGPESDEATSRGERDVERSVEKSVEEAVGAA